MRKVKEAPNGNGRKMENRMVEVPKGGGKEEEEEVVAGRMDGACGKWVVFFFCGHVDHHPVVQHRLFFKLKKGGASPR